MTSADPFRPLKSAFGRFATGVVIAGCRPPQGEPVMITVNSFTSVSLAPPLVLWCIDRRAVRFPAFMAADGYSINVLKAEQQSLSECFARSGSAPLEPDLFTSWTTGAPVLRDALAAFDCRIVDRHSAGDHVVLIAEVLKFASSNGKPLLYFASRYAQGPESGA